MAATSVTDHEGAISVTRLSLTPVKGTRIHRVDSVELDGGGARGDRRFFVIDDRGRMVNAKQVGALQSVVARCHDGRLAVTFPDGETIEDSVRAGEPIKARFYSRTVAGRRLDGPWAAALSEHCGRTLALVEPAEPVPDRGAHGAVSLISSASLARLAAQAGEASLDSRRFRMLVEVDGVPAHSEDAWVGRRLRVGSAVVQFRGHVGRCLITSRDPDTGVIDLPTLDLLRAYRGNRDTTEPLAFGVYGQVLEAGTVAVGDRVVALAQAVAR